MDIKMVCLIGPSGSGKTTIAMELCKAPRFMLAKSTTTRDPRGDESDIEYDFMSTDEFLYKDRHQEFIESTRYNGNWYGLLAGEIERINKLNKIAVRPIDFHGAIMCKKKYGDACKWFYIDRNDADLLDAIMGRKIPAYAKINRISTILAEKAHAQYCDYIIQNNGTIAQSIEEIAQCVSLYNASHGGI
ncbi:MAG: hypothetical protein NC548_06045 [Lachnospiraceae bacterium]|nr:hypothetical protein [Lachnospiraceae bacterium]